MKITGTLVNYGVHCKRQAYLHAHDLTLEDNSDLVKIGKYLHEERATKYKDTSGKSANELLLDSIKIDSIEGDYVVEYKKKNSSEAATKAQLLYYLYILKQKGVFKKGKLKFKENRDDIIIELTPENERYIRKIISEVEELILGSTCPDVINQPKCKRCAYFDYCYI